jgi:hypothetical protein
MKEYEAMKYDVTLCPRETTYTLSVEAASPQLAALHADRKFGITYDVASVNGVPCIGKCERCERHVFENDTNKFAVSSGVMCGLCVKEVQHEARRS